MFFRKEFRSLRKLEKKLTVCSTARKKKVITPANYIRRVDIALNLFTKKIFRTAYLKRSKRCLNRELLLWLWVYFRTTVCQEGNFDLLFLYQPIAKLLLIDLCCHRMRMVRANLNKSKNFVTNTTAASKFIPKRYRICINWNSLFQTQIC